MKKKNMLANAKKTAAVLCMAAICIPGSVVAAQAADTAVLDADGGQAVTTAIDFGTAQTQDMKIGDKVSGALTFGKSRMRYKFVLSTSGRFSFDATAYADSIKWRVLDSSDSDVTGKALASDLTYNSDLGFGKSSEKLDLTAGTYYLEISTGLNTDIGATRKYELTTSFTASGANEKEPNNDYQQAQVIGSEGTVKGQLAANDEKDVYKLTLKRSKKLNLKLTGTSIQSCELNVYDDSANAVMENKLNPLHLSELASGEYSVTLDAGTYYIAVSTDLYGCTGAYSLYYSVKQTLGSDDVTLSATKASYTGKTINPKLTVTDALGYTLKEGTDYTVTVPAGRVNPGSYTYKVAFKGDYKGSAQKTFTIARQAIGDNNVTLSKTTAAYTGSVVSPKLTVKDNAGKVLTNGTDYTVSVPSGRKNAGTYTYKVTMKGNYTGTVNKKLVINKVSVDANNVKLSSAKAAYNGSAKNPSVVVRDSSGKKLVKGTDYTVKVPSGRKNIGTYTYKITMKGNYKGAVSKTFTIVPAKTAVSKVTKAKNGVKVTWKKSGNATGYILYRSVNGGAYKRVKTISSARTVSYLDKKATVKGKKYSYKVVVYKKVNDRTYKSASSAAKAVKR